MAPRALPLSPADAGRMLAGARGGDVSAFEATVREHQGMVFSLAYHFLGEAGAAEDVAQDVFFELSRRLARIESPEHLVFWLRKVTANRCIDRLRSRRPEEQAVDAAVLERPAPDTTRDVLLDQRLRELIRTLAPDARAVMLLRYQEDLDPTEIARVLEMPVNTVKSHMRRSIELMRAALDGKVGE